MAYPPSDDDLTSAKTTIVNILKMEGYKLDSGSLFLAFKDAGGEMSQFAPSLEELQNENIIKSDSEGNIMTVEDYQREKSQNKEDSEDLDLPSEEESEFVTEEINDEIINVEKEILDLKNKSPEKIRKIAVETSSDLIKQLIGVDVNNSSISAIVDDLSKRNGDKYYDN